MFEDAIFESAGTIHTRSANWMLATFALNGAILAALIALPLIYPEALPHRIGDLLLIAPPPPSQPPQLVRATAVQAFRGAPQMTDQQLVVPRRIPHGLGRSDDAGAPTGDRLIVMDAGPGSGIPGGLPGAAPAPVVTAAPRVHGPIRISSGVAQGLILNQTVPQYPAIARAMRLEGTVKLEAEISKSGTIENVRVLGGPAVLQQASIDAVRQWRFRPFLLNGEPVAVETTINVVFRLGS